MRVLIPPLIYPDFILLVCLIIGIFMSEMQSYCINSFFSVIFDLISPTSISVQFSRSVVSDSFATPRTIALQAFLSMGFPRQEYWSRLPFPSLGDLPNLGTEPTFPALAGRFFTTEPLGEPSM